MKSQNAKKRALLYTVAMVYLGTAPAHAATNTWDGGWFSADWNTSLIFGLFPGYNWNPNANPVAGDDLVFAGTTQLTNNNNYADGTAFNSITFDSTAGEFLLNGNAITLGEGGIVNNDTDTQTINAPLVFKAERTVDAASGDLVLAGPISGSGGLFKTGDNTLTLAGDNTYAGGTVIDAGTLFLEAGSGIGSGALTIGTEGALAGFGTINADTTITGTHAPGGTEAGMLDFSANLSYEGGAQILWDFFSNSTAGRGTDYDSIDVGGLLAFNGITELYLSFDGPGSTVDWHDSFWSTSHSTVLFDVTGGLLYLENLAIMTMDWQDASGKYFDTELADAYFSLSTDGRGDVYLNYTIPEPTAASSVLLFGSALLVRRRMRGFRGISLGCAGSFAPTPKKDTKHRFAMPRLNTVAANLKIDPPEEDILEF